MDEDEVQEAAGEDLTDAEEEDELQLEIFRGWKITKRTISVGGAAGIKLDDDLDLSKIERVRITFEADVVADQARKTKKVRTFTVNVDRDTFEIDEA